MIPGDQPLVAVLDSSVLVPYWSRVALQQLASSPQSSLVPVWSEWIIGETWRVLTWRWIQRTDSMSEAERRALTRSANRMMRRLIPVVRLVTLQDFRGPDPWPGLRDQDDIPIWQTAIVAGASFVISHNTDDFPPLIQGRHVYAGIEYLTAVEFIGDLLGEDPGAIVGDLVPTHALIRSGRRV